jgi:hypothetical protein
MTSKELRQKIGMKGIISYSYLFSSKGIPFIFFPGSQPNNQGNVGLQEWRLEKGGIGRTNTNIHSDPVKKKTLESPIHAKYHAAHGFIFFPLTPVNRIPGKINTIACIVIKAHG